MFTTVGRMEAWTPSRERLTWLTSWSTHAETSRVVTVHFVRNKISRYEQVLEQQHVGRVSVSSVQGSHTPERARVFV